jgi:allantoin racemase
MTGPEHVAHGGRTERLSKPLRVWYQSFTEPQETAHYHDRLVGYAASAARAGTTIDVKGMSPPSRRHRITELRCALDVVRNAIEAERAGFDAFLVGHFQDSGLYEARSAVDIPVVGLGESSMLHACTLGSTVGLITIHPCFIPIHRDQIRRYGLHERITHVSAVESSGTDYVRAFQDPAAARDLADKYVREIDALVRGGTEVVLPAGGLPALLFGDEVRTSAAPGVLVDCISIAIKACEMAVDLRRFNGTGPSRLMTFSKPSDAALAAIGVSK